MSNFRTDAVVYYKTDGEWLEHSVWGQWSHSRHSGEFDCEYVGGQLYYHESGGGQVWVAAHSKPEPCPAKIWIREGVDVRGSPRAEHPAPLDDLGLRALGYQRVDGPDPDPFDDAIEGRTIWCDACDSRVLDEDTGDCCVCGEATHIHLGSAVAIVNPDEGALSSAAGVYVVLRQPFVMHPLVGSGSFMSESLARIGDLPDGAETDYAGAPLCRRCAPDPDPAPAPAMTPYQFGLLRRLALTPRYLLTSRQEARLLALGALASIELVHERSRLIAEIRRQANEGDVRGLRRAARALWE